MGKRCIAKGEVRQRAIFSENHSKREKGLKVKRDASTKFSMTKAMKKPKGYCRPERSRGITLRIKDKEPVPLCGVQGSNTHNGKPSTKSVSQGCTMLTRCFTE